MMRRLKALGATLVLLILVVGIPLGMAATIGNPLHGWADLKVGDLTDEVIIDLLAVIVWLAWAQFAVSVLVEFVAAVRHMQRPTRIPLVPGSSQHLAHTLVGAALLLGTATAALASPVHALAATSARPVAEVATVHTQSQAGSHRTATTSQQASTLSGHQAQTATPARTVSYVIPSDGRGPDTYWDIAEARLGGGEHWQQIWDLNRGRTQPDGEVMNNPGLLKPGWTVLLPATATSPAAAGTHVEDVIVQEGDTLSGIARAHGVSDWHQVWEASMGRAEPSGQRLTDPDLIQPGWTVEIPVSKPTTQTPTTTTPTTQGPTQQTPKTPTQAGSEDDARRADARRADTGPADTDAGPVDGPGRSPPRAARQPS